MRKTFRENNYKADTAKKYTVGETKYYEGIVSIIIPVFNGGDELKRLIPVLKAQEKIRKIDIIAIDSGSNDGSAEFLKNEAVSLIEIPKNDFSHSKTRNLGAEKASGEILLFMTQDALPPDSDWVFKMIMPIVEYGATAASCVERPKDECSVFSGVENNIYRSTFDMADKIIHLPKGKNLKGWWQRNTRLNDVACAVKKEALNLFPYRGEFAEDVDLAVRLLQGGHAIAVLSSIEIIHSHERSNLYIFCRAYISAVALRKIMPDSKRMNKQLKKIIDSAMFAYYSLQSLFEYFKSLQENFEPADFFGFSVDFWIGSFKKIIAHRTPDLCMTCSAPALDNFLLLVFSYYPAHTARETGYTESLMRYFDSSLRKYVCINFVMIDIELKEQIIDALLKKWLLLFAYDLGLYFSEYPNINNPLFIALEEMSKGI